MRLKMGLVLAALFFSSAFGFSQTVEGPKEVDSRALSEFKLLGDFGGTPKVLCVPGSTSWKLVRDPEKPDLSIIFVPNDDEKGITYSFLAFGAKNGQPIVAQASTKVKGGPTPTPVPPVPTPPGPTPVVNRWSDAVKAAYLVNPDAPSLQKLIGALTEVKGTKFTSHSEASTVLKNTVVARVDGQDGVRRLPKLRDTISYDIIAKEIGDDGDAQWDQSKFEKLLTEVIEALGGLK